MPEGTEPLSIEGWLMRGAIREDDLGTALGFNIGDDPHDDPYGSIVRVANHFYDPVYNRSLTVGSLTLGEMAPNWALGTADAFASLAPENTNRRNHFSVRDAREAMFRALTLKRKNADGSYADIGPSGSLTTKSDVRNAYWATTFRSLGDVLHLNQDMAQPQHTRNETHTGPTGPLLGHKSVYESYIDSRARGETNFTIDNRSIIPAPLVYVNSNSPYPLPAFTKYSDFWSTRDGANGRGLADYSNRGFFTTAHNLGEGTYTSPSNDPANPGYTKILLPCQYTGNVKLNYLVGGVPDTLANTTDSAKMTSLSIWSVFGALLPTRLSYSLNKCNYDDAADLLVPRAVAYSAGLINYFFRGRIEPKDIRYTDTGLSFRVKNAIDLTQSPQYTNESLTTGGTLILAFDYKIPDATAPGGHHTEAGSSNIVNLTETVAPGQVSQALYAFTLPTLPDNATDVRYRLVYRGQLGNENDAVVAGALEPLWGFVFTPSYAASDGVSGPRLVYRAGGVNTDGASTPFWKLSMKSGVLAGNVDWKGWYDSGKPTKVLSWMGPRARYFKAGGDPDYGPNVYQDGELWAVAPGAVLGAALNKDAQGNEWVVVISNNGSSDIVYRRPNKKSNSAALYHPTNNPEGWQLLNSFPMASGQLPAEAPWFFNGTGTEAQTVRKAQRPVSGVNQVIYDASQVYQIVPASGQNAFYLDRFKITVAESSADLVPVASPAVNRSRSINYQDPPAQCLENCDPNAVTPTVNCVAGGGLAHADSYVQSHWVDNAINEINSSDTGSYVIAVDYTETDEVLAKVQVLVNEKDSMISDSSWYHPICANAPGGGNREEQSFYMPGSISRANHQFISSTTRTLNLGAKSYPLEQHQFDTAVTRTRDMTNQTPDVVTASFSAPSFSLSDIYYADLRTGTLLYDRDDRTYYLTDEPIDQFQKKVRYDSVKRLNLDHDNTVTLVRETQNNAVHSHWYMTDATFTPVDSQNGSNYLTSSFVRGFEVPVVPFPMINGADIYVRGQPANLYVGDYSLGASFSNLSLDGGVGVDSNKNLFASFSYQDAAGVYRYLNHLTGGDITQLVPTAPADANYQGIGVVR